jgi:hypothetical protein
MSEPRPTDEQIMAVVRHRPDVMTYVVRNVLASRPWGSEPHHPVFKNLDTSFVRRRLMALEKAGKVERVSTAYAVQICWRATPARLLERREG